MSIKDRHGVIVKQGDTLSFSFGIPPIAVRAEVILRDNQLVVLTPNVNPKECLLSDLEGYIGEFELTSC